MKKRNCFVSVEALSSCVKLRSKFSNLYVFVAAKNADEGCYDKLNTEAAGYGTCDPTSNTSCAARYDN